ncbi:MAG TPA: hypothetical protein VJG67_01665 [Candidatus Paceibacterota bacterium]
MTDKVSLEGKEYSVGQSLRLKGFVAMGIPVGQRIKVAELRDPKERLEFIGADLDWIDERLWFTAGDILELPSPAYNDFGGTGDPQFFPARTGGGL